MPRFKVWGLRLAGSAGLVLAIASPFSAASGATRAVDTLAGLFMSCCLFLTLGPRWNLFAFAIAGLGMVGFASVFGLDLVTTRHPSGFELVLGWFMIFAAVFFLFCAAVGLARWIRTGSPYPGGKVDPRVASGWFAVAAASLNSHSTPDTEHPVSDQTP